MTKENDENDEIMHGEKSIKITVLFHTNGLDNLKTAWVRGKTYATINKARGIRPTENPSIFNNIEEILPSIMKVLKENNIELVQMKNGDRVIIDKKKYIKKK